MYPKGTIKVVWIERDTNYLDSQMFPPNKLQEAVAFGEKKGEYMVTALDYHKGDYYRWVVMPYGNYDMYNTSLNLQRVLKGDYDKNTSPNKLTSPQQEINNNPNNYNKDVILPVQKVRLIDVFIIAPFLIWLSFNKNLGKGVQYILLFLGVMTLAYNATRYLLYKEDELKQKKQIQ